jgi:hypothetical protein
MIPLNAQRDDPPPLRHATPRGRERLVVVEVLDGQVVSAEAVGALEAYAASEGLQLDDQPR